MYNPTNEQANVLRRFGMDIDGLNMESIWVIGSEINLWVDGRASLEDVIYIFEKILKKTGLIKEGYEAFERIMKPAINQGLLPFVELTIEDNSWFGWLGCNVCKNKNIKLKCGKCDLYFCSKKCSIQNICQ